MHDFDKATVDGAYYNQMRKFYRFRPGQTTEARGQTAHSIAGISISCSQQEVENWVGRSKDAGTYGMRLATLHHLYYRGNYEPPKLI